jgi:hypothetical protein
MLNLENNKFPFTVISNRPSFEGTNVILSISGSFSFKSSAVKLTARSV